MTDRQRVGQVFLVGIPATGSDPAAAVAVAVDQDAGGYLLYAGSRAGVAAVRTMTAGISARLAGRAGGVQPFVAVDQEGGQVQGLAGPGFSAIPQALTQGTWTTGALRSSAAQWGRELRAAGVNLDLAPVLDVVPASLGAANKPIGYYHRQFGATPAVVTSHGLAVIAGLRDAGVLATAKHFPGLGRVLGNTDTSSGVTDSYTGPGDPSVQPFQAAVGGGVRFVMLSLADYPRFDPKHLAVFSPAVVALLRRSWGFHGIVVSDDLGNAAQVAAVPPVTRALDFLAAGGQLIVVVEPATTAKTMMAGVVAAEAADPAIRSLVDRAAQAVLVEKAADGLLRC